MVTITEEFLPGSVFTFYCFTKRRKEYAVGQKFMINICNLAVTEILIKLVCDEQSNPIVQGKLSRWERVPAQPPLRGVRSKNV